MTAIAKVQGSKSTVSKRDRDYFRRLGEFEAETARIQWDEHMNRALDDRLARSWNLSRQSVGRASRANRYDDPSVLYDRARRLGLYR